MELFDVLHCLFEDRERRKPQEVELDEADVFNVLLVVLADRVFRLAVRVVERTEVREFPRGDQHAARVHAEVSRHAFQGHGETNEFLIVLFLFNGLLELGNRFERLFERDAFAGLLRNELREIVRLPVRNGESARDVTHDRLGAERTEGRDLTDGIDAVGRLHVLDHAVAVVLTEVDVKVRHRHTFRIQETFKKEIEFQGIQVGNPERVGNERTGTGTAPRSHGNVVALRPVDKVLNDQEVARELHLLDDAEFVFQTLVVFLADFRLFVLVGIKKVETLLQTLFREIVDVVVQGHAVGRRKERQLRLRENAVQIATQSDLHRIFQSRRNVCKQLTHLFLGLEVHLFRERLIAAGVVERVALRNAATDGVRLVVFRHQKLHRVRSNHGHVHFDREVDELMNECLVCGASRALQFHIQTIPEDLLVAPQFHHRERREFMGIVTRERPFGAARQRNEAFPLLSFKPLELDLSAQAVFFREIRTREKFAQMAIAFTMHAVHRQTIRFVRHGGIVKTNVATDDGLETGLHGVGVKTNAAEEIHDVGNPESHTAVFKHFFNDRIDAHHPVDDGVLGMKSQVDKARIGHDNKCREIRMKLTIGDGERLIRHGQDGPKSFTREHPRQIRMHQYGMDVLVGRKIRCSVLPAHGKERRAPCIRLRTVGINDGNRSNVCQNRTARLGAQNVTIALAVLFEKAFIRARRDHAHVLGVDDGKIGVSGLIRSLQSHSPRTTLGLPAECNDVSAQIQ